MTIFATIEHSVSRETIRTMEWNTGKNGQLLMRDQLDGPPPRHFVVWIHLSNEEMLWLHENRAGHRIVTTARDEAEIVKSWERRGKDLSLLQEQMANYEELLAMGAWVVVPGANH